ncbi:MAG: LCP family protein [Patescibacteria group bacterium]
MNTTTSDTKEAEELQSGYKKLASQIWIKSLGYTLFFLFIFLFGSIIILGSIALYKTNQFRTAANLSWSELKEIATKTLKQEPIAKGVRKNILLLGSDEISNREDHPVFTDSMMLLSIDLNSGKIYTLPIPRDLWSEEYKTKINALYIYGQERDLEKPEKFPQDVISQLADLEINNSIVLTLNQLAQMIDLVGGVDIEIKESFIDNKFPRTNADISSKNEEELYETVSFEKGKERMSGERALKYIRSRHSEGDEGTDLARSERQQQVISSLISQLSSANTLKNMRTLGKLYVFYQNNFDQYLSSIELTNIIRTLIPQRNNIEFSGQSLSIYPDENTGVITHPNTKNYNNQWVYIIRDELKFKEEVKNKLNL